MEGTGGAADRRKTMWQRTMADGEKSRWCYSIGCFRPPKDARVVPNERGARHELTKAYDGDVDGTRTAWCSDWRMAAPAMMVPHGK
jgi:hypothetical protein